MVDIHTSNTSRSNISVPVSEFVPLVGKTRADRLAKRTSQAAELFERERYPEARSILKSITDEAPGSQSARELSGICHYRIGNYVEAAKQLEAFYVLVPNSTEQHPVLMDSYRAQKKYTRVAELWRELREASPSAELVTEGRLIAAGALADQGRIADAIREMEKSWKAPKRPKEFHLRRAYFMGDLYEQAGEINRARASFLWVQNHDPEFFDVGERLAFLSK